MWLRTTAGAHDVPVRDYFPDDVEPAPAASGLVARDLEGPLGRVRVLVPADREPRVLMLHGVSLDSDSWTPLLRAAARAGQTSPPWLLVDVPGFGGSDRLPSGTSLDRLCDAVADVLGRLCTPPVHLVGHSMGGFAALHLAATRGDLLVCMDERRRDERDLFARQGRNVARRHLCQGRRGGQQGGGSRAGSSTQESFASGQHLKSPS